MLMKGEKGTRVVLTPDESNEALTEYIQKRLKFLTVNAKAEHKVMVIITYVAGQPTLSIELYGIEPSELEVLDYKTYNEIMEGGI